MRATAFHVSRLALILVVALGPSGCAWKIQRIETGNTLALEDFEKIEVDASDLQDVLDVLGPPDEITFTLTEEIFEYRHGYFRGTNLTVSAIFESLPGLSFVIGLFRSVFNQASGFGDDSPVFQIQDPMQFFLPFILGQTIGFAVDGISTQDALDLRNRQIRYSILRVSCERGTGVVREKSYRDGLTGEVSIMRSTILGQ